MSPSADGARRARPKTVWRKYVSVREVSKERGATE